MMHNIHTNNESKNRLTSSEIIYSEQLKILLRSKEKVDRSRALKLVVSIVTTVSPVLDKTLAIQITDDDDPFVLYAVMINEVDFLTIKEQQGLIIEYDKLSSQLIKLLNLCKIETCDGCNFHLVIEESSGDTFGSCHTFLKVFETNQLKQLCHLSLTINRGTDSEIKRHVTVQLKKLQDALSDAECRASLTESRVVDLEKKLKQKDQDLEQLQKRWHDENEKILERTTKEVKDERGSLLKSQQDLQKSFETERKLFEEMLTERNKHFESILTELQTKNKVLYGESCELDSKFRREESKVELLRTENAALKREVTVLHDKNLKLDTGYHIKEETLKSSIRKEAGLEKKLGEVNANVTYLQNLLQERQQHISNLEETLVEKEAYILRRDSAMKTLSGEFSKGHDILRKLHGDVSALTIKLRLRTSIIMKQEHTLASKEKEVDAMNIQLEKQQKTIGELQIVEKQLSESLKTETAKLKEKETLLGSNAKLINWLNQRINELQISQGKPTTFGTGNATAQGESNRRSSPLGRGVPAFQGQLTKRSSPYGHGTAILQGHSAGRLGIDMTTSGQQPPGFSAFGRAATTSMPCVDNTKGSHTTFETTPPALIGSQEPHVRTLAHNFSTQNVGTSITRGADMASASEKDTSAPCSVSVSQTTAVSTHTSTDMFRTRTQHEKKAFNASSYFLKRT